MLWSKQSKYLILGWATCTINSSGIFLFQMRNDIISGALPDSWVVNTHSQVVLSGAAQRVSREVVLATRHICPPKLMAVLKMKSKRATKGELDVQVFDKTDMTIHAFAGTRLGRFLYVFRFMSWPQWSIIGIHVATYRCYINAHVRSDLGRTSWHSSSNGYLWF